MDSRPTDTSGRPKKRARQLPPRLNTFHDRVRLEDDFEVVHARTSSLTNRGALPNDSERSPLRGRTTWNIGTPWAPADDPELALDPDDHWYDEAMGADVGEYLSDSDDGQRAAEDVNDDDGNGGSSESTGAAGSKRKKKSETSTRPHLTWKTRARDTYLDELLRWEGRGEFSRQSQCPDCVKRGEETPGDAEVRCMDCFLPDLTCGSCCLRRHQLNPLHLIERWTGTSFEKTSLKDIGLVIHLNHASLRCPAPSAVDSRFRVIHTTGVHEVAIQYCGCHREIPQHLQLIRRGLYPASQQAVRTCVTFPLLRLLHLFTLTSKIGTYDMYRALERLTANSAVRPPKSRYRPLKRVLVQWRHLKLLKRGGRGHENEGVGSTKNGALALLCPSCPHPGINIPDDWRQFPKEKLFLFVLLVCMDANFRLKNQLVSNFSTDPGLGIGWAYMVPRHAYEAYVLSQADEEDISTCVGFQALAKATTRNSRGLRYTGVGAVVCGRSEMVLPNGVGNLQKGERYANMDYILAYSIRATQVLLVAISYDIVCQWFIHLFKRIVTSWPTDLRPRPGLHLRPVIPKFHAPAHHEKDHDQYDLNLAEGMGLADCEAPERLWASHNGLASSCRTTGPGTLHDIYDDNFGFWNWQKYTAMGTSLLRRLKSAVSERNQQLEAHRGFTQSLPEDLAASWEEMCMVWDSDGFPKSKASPFWTENASISEEEAKAELEHQEAAVLQSRGSLPRHKTSAVSFLAMGLELEESQRRLKELAKDQKDVPKSLQDSSLKDQRQVLKAKIQAWEHVRAVYMPGLLQILVDKGASPATAWDSNPLPEVVELSLPSSLLDRISRNAACVDGLADVESALRTAQLGSSLQSLRQVLRLKTRMVYFKNKNIRGQRSGTRSRAVIDRVHKRAVRLVQKYRIARAAKLLLDGRGDWETVYRDLRNEDVRGYDSGRKQKGKGRVGIWEDGHQPPPPQADLVDALESEDEDEIEMEDGTTMTETQLLKARKKGTGQTRKKLSWIWMAAPMLAADGSDADDILRSEWARSRARGRRATEEVELVTEEMRRVLEFLDWKASWWDDRERLRSTLDTELSEGLKAYAERQAELQRALKSSFQHLWRTTSLQHDISNPHVNPATGAVDEAIEDDDDDSSDEDDEDESHGVGY